MAEPQARQNFETMPWEDGDVTYGDLFGRIISENSVSQEAKLWQLYYNTVSGYPGSMVAPVVTGEICR